MREQALHTNLAHEGVLHILALDGRHIHPVVCLQQRGDLVVLVLHSAAVHLGRMSRQDDLHSLRTVSRERGKGRGGLLDER